MTLRGNGPGRDLIDDRVPVKMRTRISVRSVDRPSITVDGH